MKWQQALSVAAVGLAVSMAWGQAADPAPQTQPGGRFVARRAFALKTHGAMTLETMTQHVELTAEQKTRLQTLCDDLDKQLKDWQDDMSTLWKGVKDPAGWQKIQTDVQEMNAERQKMVETFDADIGKLLTPEQRTAWEIAREAAKLLQAFNMRYGYGTKFTAEQKALLEKLCKDAAKQLRELKDPKDMAARTLIIGQLLKQIVATVLTEEQAGKVLGGWMIAPGPTMDAGGMWMMGPGGGWGGGQGVPGQPVRIEMQPMPGGAGGMTIQIQEGNKDKGAKAGQAEEAAPQK